MRELFSPDSKAMQLFETITDFIILNFIYLLTCIPVFTIGAATAALYTVCFRIGTDREDRGLKSYFAAFRDNFKQGTIVWLVILAVMLCASFGAVLLYQMEGMLRFAAFPLAAFGLLSLMAFSYAFPLISRFENTTAGTLANACVLSIIHMPRSLLMMVINFFPIGLLFLDPNLWMRIGFIWCVCYFSVAAWVNTKLLRKVFAPFMPQEEPTADEQ